MALSYQQISGHANTSNRMADTAVAMGTLL
jgi:hypothetical protein